MIKGAKNTIYFSLNIITPLALGVVIYLFARPETIISQILYEGLQINNERIIALPSFLTNYGCDFLWSYSLTHCLYFLSKSYKSTLSICIAFCVFAELIQLFPFVRLVFDPIDIFVEIAGIILGLCFIFLFQNKFLEKKRNTDLN